MKSSVRLFNFLLAIMTGSFLPVTVTPKHGLVLGGIIEAAPPAGKMAAIDEIGESVTDGALLQSEIRGKRHLFHPGDAASLRLKLARKGDGYSLADHPSGFRKLAHASMTTRRRLTMSLVQYDRSASSPTR